MRCPNPKCQRFIADRKNTKFCECGADLFQGINQNVPKDVIKLHNSLDIYLFGYDVDSEMSKDIDLLDTSDDEILYSGSFRELVGRDDNEDIIKNWIELEIVLGGYRDYTKAQSIVDTATDSLKSALQKATIYHNSPIMIVKITDRKDILKTAQIYETN